MEKTNKKAVIIDKRSGGWIERRIWADGKGNEMIKFDGIWWNLWLDFKPEKHEIQTWID